MMEIGLHNPSLSLSKIGPKAAQVYYNYLPSALVQEAIQRGEGQLGAGGSFVAITGEHTGRSPKDKFIVGENSVEANIDWEANKRISAAHFEQLKADMFAHAEDRELFVQDLYAGADPTYRLNVRVMTELAWHGLFIRNLLRRPEIDELNTFSPEYRILNLPSFNANPEKHGCRTETIIAISFEQKLILIGGTSYAGENKKSVFTLLNYILPEQDVMPMHCSANHAPDNPDDSAVFFGLSGTGKTTLSADPSRVLIGDDEHGWSDNGIFNFEGGCYAKTIRLSAEAEPEIYAATSKFGVILENVVLDPVTRQYDFDDVRHTENTRVAYPMDVISNASETSLGGMPKHVIMLTCDAFGVLPPIARLTPAQAMYHFLSGFTAKVAGTEKGLVDPEPTFSTCFGAPFMPRRPEVYGDLLRQKISTYGSHCWLVNTGWTGGPYGVGSRMPIKETRALLRAALDGSLVNATFRRDVNFQFEVPVSVPGVTNALLDPRSTWSNPAEYDSEAAKLVNMFCQNFEQYLPHVDDEVKAASLGVPA